MPALMRGVGFLIVALLIFAPFNFVTIRQLLRTHPRRRSIVIALAVAGNLMWPFLLLLRQLTPLTRITRAVLGPAWFAWQSFAIVYTVLTLVIFLAWLAVRRRAVFATFARWPSRAFLTLALIGTVIGVYHALVPLRTQRVSISVNNLPAEAEGTRLALLSDLHVGMFTRPARLEKIFSAANAVSPHAVLLAGDLIDDDPFFVPKLLAGTKTLDPSIPLLAVLGNHEMYGDAVGAIQKLRGSRIRLLVNEGHAVGAIWIAGISDYASPTPALQPDLARALSGAPIGSLSVILSHQPKAFDEAHGRQMPLTLAGHTHGGQFGFRPLRWSLAGVFLKRHMGLYREGGSQLYINTGTGYWLVPFRLGMTPEITLIELRRGN